MNLITQILGCTFGHTRLRMEIMKKDDTPKIPAITEAYLKILFVVVLFNVAVTLA